MRRMVGLEHYDINVQKTKKASINCVCNLNVSWKIKFSDMTFKTNGRGGGGCKRNLVI